MCFSICDDPQKQIHDLLFNILSHLHKFSKDPMQNRLQVVALPWVSESKSSRNDLTNDLFRYFKIISDF